VDGVADELRVSRRYLEKNFLEKVGVSPKFYARIKRFTELSKQVAYGKDWDWQEIISNFGFHDQSHLVKEFLVFNNMNPTDYFQNHKELIRLIKK
jgi:AraC-like DNA-binding protein